MRTKDSEIVRALPLFSEIAAENFDYLMKAAYLQRFPAMVQLITAGDPPDFLYIVVEGRVELFATTFEREATMGILMPVSTFILAATVNDAPLLMSARTLEPSQLLLIPSEDVRHVFDQDDRFSRAIVAELATSYRTVVKTLKNMRLRSAIERVANYLLQLEIENEHRETFELPFEKRSLASFLGMTPENLSRAFGALHSDGIEVEGRIIRIRDREALKRFAKPDRLIDDPFC